MTPKLHHFGEKALQILGIFQNNAYLCTELMFLFYYHCLYRCSCWSGFVPPGQLFYFRFPTSLLL